MSLEKARRLRKDMTEAERRLWTELRGRRTRGIKFRRQQPLGPYIVDFVCFEQKLVLELDGGQHAADRDYDEARTRWLESRGYRVLRFWNNQVFQEMEGVLQVIWEALPPHPGPPPRGGREKKTKTHS